jgi:hypothetical protein
MVDEVKDVIMGSENNKVRQAEFSWKRSAVKTIKQADMRRAARRPSL